MRHTLNRVAPSAMIHSQIVVSQRKPDVESSAEHPFVTSRSQKPGWISRVANRILRLLSFRRHRGPPYSVPSNPSDEFSKSRKRHKSHKSSSSMISSCSTSSSIIKLRLGDAEEYKTYTSCNEISWFLRGYSLKKSLGVGSFSKVHLALHKFTHEPVAIKAVHKESLGDDLPRVYLEMDALKALDHPSICKLFQIYESSEYVFMALEFCPTDLFNVVNSAKHCRLKESEARRIFYQLASAVNYCHSKGFVHRDLKLENILMDTQGNVKLIDFNLSTRIPKLSWKDKLHTQCGTIEYAAPELLRGQPYDGRCTDSWSLGVVLYCMLCGKMPFDKPNIRECLQNFKDGEVIFPKFLSSSAKSVILDLLRAEPEKRLTPATILKDPWLQMERFKHSLTESTKHPNEDDEPFDEEILEMISSELPLPYEVVLAIMSTHQFYTSVVTTSYTIFRRKKLTLGPELFGEWKTLWKRQNALYRRSKQEPCHHERI